jgi:plastocyanin
MNRGMILMLGVIGGAIAGLGCFSERRNPAGIEDIECSVPLPEAGPNQVIVAIRDFAFHPAEVRVATGTTVTWINCEPASVEAHTSTADDGAWSSPLLQGAGGAFSRAFGSPGRIDYHCAPHPFMRGSVVVRS